MILNHQDAKKDSFQPRQLGILGVLAVNFFLLGTLKRIWLFLVRRVGIATHRASTSFRWWAVPTLQKLQGLDFRRAAAAATCPIFS